MRKLQNILKQVKLLLSLFYILVVLFSIKYLKVLFFNKFYNEISFFDILCAGCIQ